MPPRVWLPLACAILIAVQAAAQPVGGAAIDRVVGLPVVSLRVASQGRDVQDPQVASLVDVAVGQPLSMAAVRRTIVHLLGLGTYLDVQVRARSVSGGVHLDIDLVPLREGGRLVFKGDTRLPEKTLRDAVALRFGPVTPLGRATDIARTLEEVFRDHGFLRASVRPRPLDDPAATPGDLVFDVEPGALTRVRSVEYRGTPAQTVQDARKKLAVESGADYEPSVLRRRISDVIETLRAGGFLEASVDPFARVSETAEHVDLTISVTRGPLVSLAFAGDALPPRERTSLVPIALEGSADEDLLEDSERRIVDYLRGQGYRDAAAPFTRTEAGDTLKIVFTVNRGPLYRVAGVGLRGVSAVGLQDLQPLIQLKTGDPFVSARLEADAATVTEAYRRRGFTRATVVPAVTARSPAGGGTDVPATVTLDVSEGVRTVVNRIVFDGARVFDESQLSGFIRSRAGDPFYGPAVNADGDRLLTEYRNRGYRMATVDSSVVLASTGEAADVRFVIREGPQILVDHILIVGNTRTSEATIRRELALQPGHALGDSAVAESQTRLAALGLFRRVTISELSHSAENLRDVLITIEEAPATSIGYGGGVEFQKVETSEFAPRGFLELGRRNLWGKNRAVNLFGRVSLRRRSEPEGTVPAAGASPESSTDLEYRVIGSYREPRFLNTSGALQVAAVFEQGSRTSFRYRHRSARVDFAERVGADWRYIAQFAVSRNEIIEDNINPVDRPLIDRLFPQVRLSSLAGTAARDTRDDAIEPGKGSLLSLNGELALRVIGSEVGYAKTFLQGFAYRRLRPQSRIVLAGGIRLGLGTGFPRTVPLTGADGEPVEGPDGGPVNVEVRDLPVSERFFAGGDTTVRGFQLDRLGAADTFDRDGTPIGGHAEIILNQEVRIRVWRDLGVVAFLDVGNVFATVNDFDLGNLRAGTGFGIRYKSPIGPIRVDLGFKLGTLRTYGTTREDRIALHISIGQAF